MKRSEMLNRITYALKHLNYKEMDIEHVANTVLTVVEVGGMKPPVEEICPVLFTTKNVWEKEND